MLLRQSGFMPFKRGQVGMGGGECGQGAGIWQILKFFSPGWETRSLSIVLGNSRKKYILFLSVTNDESTANQSIWIHGIYSFSERAWFLNLVATHSLKNSKLNDNRLRETLIWRNIYIRNPMTIRLTVLTFTYFISMVFLYIIKVPQMHAMSLSE